MQKLSERHKMTSDNNNTI